MMLHGFPPMDFSMDVSLEMQVNNNCDLCDQKVTEIMHSIIAVYSVTYGNIMKLEARANPNLFMAVVYKYRDHGKIIRLHFEGAPIAPQPGEGRGGGAYYNAPQVNYPYHSPYAPPQQQLLAGNFGYPMLKPPPPQQKEAPEGVYKQHTVPPPFAMQPPPPMPLSSYSYIEPPYWPVATPSGGKCVIM
uniref:HMA domain-containing protein n=2 Tax=Brassica campestris TaxID=3711 RepID=M4FE50_BRACM